MFTSYVDVVNMMIKNRKMGEDALDQSFPILPD